MEEDVITKKKYSNKQNMTASTIENTCVNQLVKCPSIEHCHGDRIQPRSNTVINNWEILDFTVDQAKMQTSLPVTFVPDLEQDKMLTFLPVTSGDTIETICENDIGYSEQHMESGTENAKSQPTISNREGKMRLNSKNSLYPLEAAEFQQKVMLSLSHISHRLVLLEKKFDQLAEVLTKNADKDDNSLFNRISHSKDLVPFEAKLKADVKLQRKLKLSFDALALSSDNQKEHIASIFDMLMTNEVQDKVNLMYGNNVPGKNYTDHVALTELETLLMCMLKSLTQKWKPCSETYLKTKMSELLKQSRKRVAAKQWYRILFEDKL
ncbi:uncharacterized protein LOC124806785 [Hydra vulgaris]|uniref:uncharacterized protein LOC124806785 n=1 Tax=Hydra vulgaris TaxID=6087 RepID=UPI001F5E77D6|nr:uncharacterized protein LOC124806785 [Hydra vulgaris]XP_047123886.1 uncharacterized protein LOC124806785 [Hydra vulgaris]